MNARIAAARTLVCLGLVLAGGCATSAQSVSLPPAAMMETGLPAPSATETITPTPFVPETAMPLPSPEMPTATPEPSATEPPTAEPPSPTPLPVASGPVVIGYSVGGRPIEAYRFGTGPVFRLAVHGIHGGSEWNTITLADQVLAAYTANPERIPPDVTLYLVRNLNPDGEARAHGAEGRANDHGVDLNRNWNNRWKPDWRRQGCWGYLPIGAGAYPLSEPENQALWRLITAHPFSGLIVVHSMGKIIFPAGQPYEWPSTKMAEAMAAVSWYTIPPFGYTGCEYTGQLSDWAAEHGIPTVDLELSNHVDTDYEQFMRVMGAFLTWRN